MEGTNDSAAVNVDYVIYDENGALQGGFCQPVHPDHVANHILVTPGQREGWTGFVANSARDGLELAEVVVPEAPPPAVPQKVTRRQGLQALLLAGALDNVQPCIDAIADPLERRMAQIEFDESQHFERQRPLVISIGSALSLDLDALFTAAASL